MVSNGSTNKGKLCLGHCLYSCQNRSAEVQKKDFVCDACSTSRVPLARVRFSRDATVCGKKGNSLYEVSYRVYRHVFGDYNMLIFRNEQSSQALGDKVGPTKLHSSRDLPQFFDGESAWKDGVPFVLNTHDHKLVPKPLGGASGKLAQPVQHRYSCPKCDRTFQQTGNLNSHIRIVHLGQRRFECKVCARKFPRKQNLQYHMRTHTGELPYRCSNCNRGFARKDHLRRHENKPHPYECGTASCKRRFMFKTCVELHRRRAHNVADADDAIVIDENNSRLYDDDSPERRSKTTPAATDNISTSLSNMRFQPVIGTATAAAAGGARQRGNSAAVAATENETEESESEFLSMFKSVRNDPNLCISGPSLTGLTGNTFRVPRAVGGGLSSIASSGRSNSTSRSRSSSSSAAAASPPTPVKLELLRPPPPLTNADLPTLALAAPPTSSSSSTAASSSSSFSLIDTSSITPPPYPSPSPASSTSLSVSSSRSSPSVSRSPSRRPSRSPVLMPLSNQPLAALAATQAALSALAPSQALSSPALLAVLAQAQARTSAAFSPLSLLGTSSIQAPQTSPAALLMAAAASSIVRNASRSRSPVPPHNPRSSPLSAPAGNPHRATHNLSANGFLPTLSSLTPPPHPPASASRSPSPSRLATPPPMPIPPPGLLKAEG